MRASESPICDKLQIIITSNYTQLYAGQTAACFFLRNEKMFLSSYMYTTVSDYVFCKEFSIFYVYVREYFVRVDAYSIDVQVRRYESSDMKAEMFSLP